MKFIKWTALILSMIIFVSCLTVAGFVIYKKVAKPIPDQTSDNINVLIKKPENWKKLVTDSLFTFDDLSKIDGSTVTIPMSMELKRQFLSGDEERVRNTIHNTTHYAYIGLIEKRCDIILVTEPSKEEIELASQNGVELDVVPFAFDAFVFITHKDNILYNLTVEQIQGIYGDKIKNWNEIGGQSGTIKSYQREPNSGSQTTMEQMVMKNHTLKKSDSFDMIVGMGGLVESVAEYKNGKNSIGYTFEYYVKNLYINNNVKEFSVNGIAPTFDNIRSGKYPFTASYYAVIRKGDTGVGSKIREFLLSDIGQQCVEQAGYCPIRKAGE